MAGFTFKPTSGSHSRSMSFPARSNPTTVKIEVQINKLRSLERLSGSGKVEHVCNCLSGLAQLYKLIEEVLSLPLTKQVFSKHRDEKWGLELMGEVVVYLDICGSTRDVILGLKTSISDLQSALRRRRRSCGDSGIESEVAAYNCSVKKMKREIARSLAGLKQTDAEFWVSPVLKPEEQHLVALVRVLKETSLISNSVLRSLLLYFHVPVLQQKSSRWLPVSRLLHQRTVACDARRDGLNEFERVDAALNSLLVQRLKRNEVEEMIHCACERSMALETSIEGIEKELESLFRGLIHTRVCLLNMISC